MSEIIDYLQAVKKQKAIKSDREFALKCGLTQACMCNFMTGTGSPRETPGKGEDQGEHPGGSRSGEINTGDQGPIWPILSNHQTHTGGRQWPLIM